MTTEVKEKVFRDPVHNFIRVQDQVILDLIGTSEFQRLRRIKQLGVASAVFHTRWVYMKLPVSLLTI